MGLGGEGMQPVLPGVWHRQSREAVAWVNSVAAIEGGCSGAGVLRSWPHVPGGDRRGCGAGAVPVWVVAGDPTLGTVRLSTRSASFTVPRTFHEKPSGAIFH